MVAQSAAKPLRYEVRVTGKLSEEELRSLEGLVARVEPAGTVLLADVVDRAALHGVLHRLRALGLELLEVRRLPPGDS
jgi:hypothetical protein